MTVRLFCDDSYLTEFAASIVAAREHGGRPAVLLDRTAFYATSGGQPFDTGSLGPARVLEVKEDEATGDILHVLDRPLAVGPIEGRIDWERRFDHMQQHTGQHILSQAFVEVARAPTVSFHLGVETSTIDLELPSATSEVMEQAERLASRIVFEDRPVRVIKTKPEELGSLGVRKLSERLGEIRVIDVEGFDRSPCGGTHVRRSGEIGVIAVLDFERYKGGTRVEFACGGRALAMLRRDHATLKQLGRLYSTGIADLPALAARQHEEREALRKEKSRLERDLLDWEARALVASVGSAPGWKTLRRAFEGRSVDALKLLAQRIIAAGADLAILGLRGDPAAAVLACGPRLAGDCGATVRHCNALHGGKGGGKPELASAGAITPGALDAWLEEAESRLTKDLRNP